MNHDYEDIRSRIAEEPQWFDEHAVPRYCEFTPRACANIYASEAALVLIQCQACQTQFLVAFSHGSMEDVLAHMRGAAPTTLAEQIRNNTVHYGDPPNTGCCAAGSTMNSEPLRVLEFWERSKHTNYDWKRRPGLEVELPEDGSSVPDTPASPRVGRDTPEGQ